VEPFQATGAAEVPLLTAKEEGAVATVDPGSVIPVTPSPRVRAEVGFYGKLPSHGDFLARRTREGFVGAWDPWLQEAMTASRLALGDGWLEVYLTSPVWRYVCASGACGSDAVAGILVPSVDKVGRYFPLTVVTELPPDTIPVTAAACLEDFFDAAERLLVETMAQEQIDFDRFDQAVVGLGDALARAYQPAGMLLEPAAAALLADAAAGPWSVPIAAPSALSSTILQAAAHRLAELYAPMVLWWTAGSEIVQPSCLVTKGLPRPEQFVAMMNASWDESRWNLLAAHVDLPASTGDTQIDDPTPPQYRSAAATDTGVVREVNQDSYLERSEVGLWVVADGVGGHQEGDVASRMVCDALAGFAPTASFEEMIDAARSQLHAVNDHLLRASVRPVNPVVSGSTVVTLLARGTRCAVLWAGDSRAYRWRNGKMEQLTRDHSVAELEGETTSHAITRALGGEATLALDLFRDRVRTGDRFLLCSDGLVRVLRESDIAEWMAADDIAVAAQGLVKETVDRGAPDNVTALIVEAYGESAQQGRSNAY
jgi:type VI secretion system protein ImpM